MKSKEPKLGARVRVFSAGGNKGLGFGTYIGKTLMGDIAEEGEDLGEIAGMETPIILLESGEEVYGFQCWWIEAEEESPSIH